jgi:release factor glutamine methyltransferase
MLRACVRASGRAVGGDGRVAGACRHIPFEGIPFYLLFSRPFYPFLHFFPRCWQARVLAGTVADRLAAGAGIRGITVREALCQADQHIGDVDARMLMQQVLDASHAYLIVHSDQVLTAEQAQKFRQLIERRVAGEPIAYITGKREFYGMDFVVSPSVLIPRPETELLVDLALERIPSNRTVRILDLGTGSGAIAIAIAKCRPLALVTAVDISPGAAAIARANMRQHDVDNLSIVEGDWFGGVAGEIFDLIVANPPYVARADPHLSQGDLRFEPPIALSGGEDGLDCLRQIIAAAPAHLAESGSLLVEHGYDQAEICRELLDIADYDAVFTCPDLAGIMRVSGGFCPGSIVRQ